MNDLISIIVPVYNVEKYVKNCISTLIEQTYVNIEIVVVDDGSLDSSLDICRRMAKEDSRIRVFHKSNGGLSSARNFGINKSTGDYLTFVDSDDYVDRNFVYELYNNLVKYGADVSCCAYRMVYEKKNVDIVNGTQIKVYDKEEALKNMYLKNDIGMIFCNKLFKKELFDNVEFPAGKHFEDINTIYKVFDHSKVIVYSPNCLYFYVQRNDSINGKNFKNSTFNKTIYDLFYANKETYEFIKLNYPSVVPKICGGVVNYNLRVINQLIRYNVQDNEIVESTKNLIRDNKGNLKRDKEISFKKKIQYFIFYNFFGLYKILIKMLYVVIK